MSEAVIRGMTVEELKEKIELGIIGAGDMGNLYAQKFKEAGWKKVNICDLPSRYEELSPKYPEGEGIKLWKDGYAVSRRSDFIMYSVEAGHLDKVVSQFGPATKAGAIVAGQTSVKAPEIAAFETHLPSDVDIITCHSMHGPSVDPENQPLAVMEHRATGDSLKLVVEILSCLKSKIIPLTVEEHDRITANTQAVTHLAFISMGTAWADRNCFPWETTNYIGGIENVKVNVMLRIFSNKWHVYAGLAILNPSALEQTQQYADSVKDLFQMMIQENKSDFVARITEAGKFVFGDRFMSKEKQDHLLLSDKVLDRFSMGAVPDGIRLPNSHLSLLAIVDCWYRMGINPYDHIVCQTPPFRVWLGIVEFLFVNHDLMEQTLHCALYEKALRLDDLSFFSATQGWAQTIRHGIMDTYKLKFHTVQAYFQPRLQDGLKLSTEMFKVITRNINNPSSS